MDRTTGPRLTQLASTPASASVPAHGRKRVLILISDTGGGHRASAQALDAALDTLRPNSFDVSIVDIWTDHGRWPHNQFVKGYAGAAKRQWIWRAMYYASATPPSIQFLKVTAKLTCSKGFEKCIRQHDPDMVVSMHPLCQDIPLEILTKMGDGVRRVPFATVVTDLGGAHPTWFHKDVDACFVPSNAVRKLAEKKGLAGSKLRQRGLPVRPDFWKAPASREELAQELGLSASRKTVLVVGGGDGVGSLEQIVDATAAKVSQACPDEAQIVAVCGKNAELRQRLEDKKYPGVNVQVKGFVQRMSDYMEMADCIVTKAGPGTIAEACIRGVPIMLSNFLPGQEAGNVPFVTDGGFGAYSPKPRAIASKVTSWLQDPGQLEEMSTRAREAASPAAALDIASDICEMIDVADSDAK